MKQIDGMNINCESLPTQFVMDKNLAWLVAEQAKRTPDVIAIIGEHPITYRELNERSEDIANALFQLKLQPEQPVGVLMERTPEMVAVLLGILRAGCAYVPLEPDDPLERSSRIIEIANCTHVIGSSSLLAELHKFLSKKRIDAEKIVLLALDTIRPVVDRYSLPACASGGDRLAYVIFTSGTTGEPKGVEVEHRNVVNLLYATRNLLTFTTADRYLATATIAFDTSVVEIFLPLITGASLLLRDRKILFDPLQLVSDIREFGITILQAPPSVWQIWLGQVSNFPKVRVVITTGEPILPTLAKQLVNLGEEAWNLYGPTEATIWATGHRLSATDEPLSSISASIGQSLDNLDCLVVNENGEPVCDGEKGELWLGGRGIARGYRNQPDLTAERFVVKDFENHRYYRTGDLVLRSTTGDLHYFGRNDDQINIHGVRVEPREIEDSLLRIPGVTQAAATWYTAPSGLQSLMAAIVWQSKNHPSARDLQQQLLPYVNKLMLPSRFVFLDNLPLTTSGKVDRNAIRASINDTENSEAVSDPGLNDTETRLMLIWKYLLGLDIITREDHFFSIGGDSLSAMQMMVEIETVFDVLLPIKTVYEAPTLKLLAMRIDRARTQPDFISTDQYIFPVNLEKTGHPLFFSNVDMKLAGKGNWSVNCPLFAISSWARGKGFIKANSLSELVQTYIMEIRRVQATGPYKLGGYSLGGLIALEIAQQLQRDGEKIELLFLLDPIRPFQVQRAISGFIEKTTLTKKPLVSRLHSILERLDVNKLQKMPYHLWHKLNYFVQETRIRDFINYQCVDWYGRWPNRLTQLLLPKTRWPAFWYYSGLLAKNYVAQSYEGKSLAIFHIQDERFQIWNDLLGEQAKTVVIETSHLGMFNDPILTEWMKLLEDEIVPKG